MDIGHGKTVIFDPKQNEFVCIVEHGSDSFAAFLNEVILQKKQHGSYHCSSHHGINHEIT